MSDRHTLMKIVVSSPYRENSVVSIASGASRRGMLDRFCTTLYAASLANRVAWLPVVGNKLERELSRRAFPGIPSEQVSSFASVEELIRIGAYRAANGFIDFPASVMYWVKDRFDAAMARDLPRHPVGAVVGMWGSTSRTFAAAPPGCIKLLNFVNSRPRFHNEYLFEYANLKQNDGEVIAPNVAALVEEEMRLADIILVPSQFILRQMPEYADKLFVLPYGVDLRQFSPGPPDARFRCNVLFVGQICYRKGFTTLIAAAQRMPSLIFYAVGPIVVPDLLKQLPPNLKYAGLVMHGDLPAVMRSADVFVLPSFEDSYGLVTLEAMASGTPAIVSDHTGTAEVVSHGEDGFLFRAGDVDDLCGCIDAVVSNPTLRERMSIKARGAVIASYSWERYSDQVLDALEAYRV